jgi:hypothetical protein
MAHANRMYNHDPETNMMNMTPTSTPIHHKKIRAQLELNRAMTPTSWDDMEEDHQANRSLNPHPSCANLPQDRMGAPTGNTN